MDSKPVTGKRRSTAAPMAGAGLLNRELVIEKKSLDKVEDNTAVRIWSEKTQQKKGDSLTEGYMSELWDFTRISVTQNNLQKLKEIWYQWDDKTNQLFHCNYGDLPYSLVVKVDKHFFRALAQYWNPIYSCFTFGKVDLVPTVEEYTMLLRCLRIQADKACSRATNIPTFLKKLMSITGINEQWLWPKLNKREIVKLLNRELVIEKKSLDKVEDNTAVRIWSEKTQQKKGDSLTEGYMSELWDFTRISVTQNNLQKLKEIWYQWDDKTNQLFHCNYGDLPYSLVVKVDKHFFRALAQYWNPIYSCFTFGKVDLVPTVEEYTMLLRCLRIQADKACSRATNIPTFLKKLMSITGINEQWLWPKLNKREIVKVSL
ncbi:hypothetical protein CXB51_025057 [Gossypium anomalum]|uniref:DUF7745 domain-containing protein n=1 Tax=Gossypium anomalum TaxID=47600 RepID=A0A8J5Y9Y2_9ROSI|nr:hypothetical protein CXB51_025057 [Gossypium anomalum]